MFFIIDKDTQETIATTRFEQVAETIAKTFGTKNCIVRFTDSGNWGLPPVFKSNEA